MGKQEWKKIAGEIVGFRDAHNLTQDELAEILGTTQVSISRWETGEHAVRHPEILRLALETVARNLKRSAPRFR